MEPKKLFVIFLMLALTISIFGCTNILSQPGGEGGGVVGGSNAGYDAGAPGSVLQGESPLEIPSNLLDDSGKMVIKRGSMEIEVPIGSLESKYAQLRQIVEESRGYVDSASYSEYNGQKSYSVIVKLPPKDFESFPEKVKQIGNLKSMNTNTEDVTLQYIDITARIRTLEAERDRLLALYNRTDSVEDILSIEEQLTRVQADIESYTAQKNQLERQASFATLTIRIYEEAPIVESAVFMPLGYFASIFFGALQVAVIVIVALSGFLIPIAVVLLVILLILRFVWRRIRGRQSKK